MRLRVTACFSYLGQMWLTTLGSCICGHLQDGLGAGWSWVSSAMLAHLRFMWPPILQQGDPAWACSSGNCLRPQETEQKWTRSLEVQAGNWPDVTSTAFYWSEWVTKSAQIQGMGKLIQGGEWWQAGFVNNLSFLLYKFAIIWDIMWMGEIMKQHLTQHLLLVMLMKCWVNK